MSLPGMSRADVGPRQTAGSPASPTRQHLAIGPQIAENRAPSWMAPAAAHAHGSERSRGLYLYIRPHTVDEAVRLLANQKAQILSGGTDFYPALADRPMHDPVLDISGLGELRGITQHAEHIRIGGLTT